MATSILVDIFTRWFDRLQVNPLPDSPDVRIIRIPVGVHSQVSTSSRTGENKRNDYDLFHAVEGKNGPLVDPSNADELECSDS